MSDKPTNGLASSSVSPGASTAIDVPAILDSFVNPPHAWRLARGVFLYYCSLASTIVVICIALVEERWSLFFINICAVTLPGIMHSANMFFVLPIVNKDIDKKGRRREAIFALLNVNKIIEVYRYLHGRPPIWSLLFKHRLGGLTWSALPSTTVNIVNLVSGMEHGQARTFLILSTCVNLVFASLSARLVHSCHGPPGNMQKYRFWDIEGRPYSSVFFMLVIDFSQIYYRLVMLALVACFAGPAYEVVLAFAMSIIVGAFAKVGLQVVPAYYGVENVMSSITAFENVIFDYPWLEPVPVYSFYIEVSYLFRLIQMIFGGMIIAARWDNRHDFDQTMFWFFVWTGGSASATYLFVYPFYVFYLMRDRVAISYEKRDEFISTMLKKRFDHQAQKRAEASRRCDSFAALAASERPQVALAAPPPNKFCAATPEQGFSRAEVQLALLDQGFDTIPIEIMRNLAGEVHVQGTVSLAFSPVEHGNGFASGVLMNTGGRCVVCRRIGHELRWSDVLDANHSGIFTEDELVDHLQRNECFRVYSVNGKEARSDA